MQIKWPHHAQDEIDAVVDVLRKGKTNYWQGGADGERSEGQLFESEFAQYTGAAHALAVTNGTTALELALYGVHQDDRIEMARQGQTPWDVIVPCRTFMATASSVVTNGMKPILADIDPVTLNVTVETLEARRTRNTIAVIVVHFAGLPADMPAIMAWARQHNIVVIEDCAHAHGARINGQHVGTFGDVGCFSFCVGKIMSTGGEGGMVVTNNPDLHARMAARRDHGRFQMVGNRDMTQFTYEVGAYGTNLRMTEMQAAIGRRQLLKLDGWNARRQEIMWAYTNGLNIPGVRAPRRDAGRVWYLYILQIFDRDRQDLLRRLNDRGIPARIGGCPNLYGEPVFKGQALPCPNADAVGARTVALPIYPTISDADVGEVIEAVRGELGW